jgi:hypothetical protein
MGTRVYDQYRDYLRASKQIEQLKEKKMELERALEKVHHAVENGKEQSGGLRSEDQPTTTQISPPAAYTDYLKDLSKPRVRAPSTGNRRRLSVPPSAVDMVFVHGLNGHPRTTWSAKNHGVFWPIDLLPTTNEDCRTSVLTYGYDADVTAFTSGSEQDNIDEHARRLFAGLTSELSHSSPDAALVAATFNSFDRDSRRSKKVAKRVILSSGLNEFAYLTKSLHAQQSRSKAFVCTYLCEGRCRFASKQDWKRHMNKTHSTWRTPADLLDSSFDTDLSRMLTRPSCSTKAMYGTGGRPRLILAPRRLAAISARYSRCGKVSANAVGKLRHVQRGHGGRRRQARSCASKVWHCSDTVNPG